MINYSRIICIIFIALFLNSCGANSDLVEKLEKDDLEILRVGPKGYNSAFGQYNVTPESLDGSHLIYIKYLELPKSRTDAVPAELWICDPNFKNHRKIIDIDKAYSHNGAKAQWINNKLVAYQDGDKIYIVNINSENIIFGPFYGEIGHYANDWKILMSTQSESGYGDGKIYEIDAKTGSKKLLTTDGIFYSFEEEFNDGYDPNKDRWRIFHLQYSPDGNKIALRFDVGDGEPNRYLFTIDRNGTSPILFGPKPVHFGWYDDNSLFGVDQQVEDGMPDNKFLRRWDLKGNYIETLAGPATHIAVSPDKNLYVTETWYNSNPVILKGYKKGEIKPRWSQTITEENTETVWGRSFHLNPSFSRDGKRVYFYNILGKDKVEASVIY